MSIIWTIIIGFIVGLLAKMLTPGRDPSGFFVTALRLLCTSIAGGCSIPARQTRLNTSRLLLAEEDFGLT